MFQRLKAQKGSKQISLLNRADDGDPLNDGSGNPAIHMTNRL